MASRRLNRIPAISAEDCLKLSKNQVLLCKDVMTKNMLELMSFGYSSHESTVLLQTVSKIVAPKPVRVSELLERQHQWFLPTHLPQLDDYMRGGLPSGTITEITGPPGCGKTQFCIMLSSLTVIDQLHQQNNNCSVLYIDTENAFTAKRLHEITTHHLNGNKPVHDGKIDANDVAAKVLVYFESTFSSLIERLEQLEEIIISQNVKMIVVDSIASLARKEFGDHTLITDRNNMLMKEATLLKYYAETFNIPVLVTNQITTSTSSDFSKDSCLIAALGNTWAHAVNTRLMVRYTDSYIRELLIAKSPLCPLSKFYYKIDAQGIVPLDD